jgi:hypothetical protein
MKKSHIVILLPLMIFWAAMTGLAQAPDLSRDFVLEVRYFEGRPFSYQKLTDWKWFELFPRVDGWKLKAGELPINAVKVFALQQPGPTTIRVKVLRGPKLDVEDVVGDYLVSEKKTVIRELVNFGVVPFEIRLVRAPATVAELPAIKNNTKSLIVSVEPAASVLPSFNARFLNSSDKPVMAFAFKTTIDGVSMFSGMPQDRTGAVLIAPGDVFQRNMPYATKPVDESTGDAPEARKGLQLNVLAVMFADGSYEGDAASALRFRGFKTGEKIQLTRIVTLLRSSAAASADLLGPKVDDLSSKVALSDVKALAVEFPGLSDGEIENARSAAEISAADLQKTFRNSFGRSAGLTPDVFPGAVKAAIAKCEGMLAVIP